MQRLFFSLFGLTSCLSGCCSPPDLSDRLASTALLDTHATRLGEAIAPLTQAHPGLSGIYPLSKAPDAFAARMLLAQAAERTLDVQYYIWRRDHTGIMLFNALRLAADRGVRVRLLLDDNNTSGLDGILAALDAHPHIEVRLFNPFMHRRLRFLSFLTDFKRVNRRMHNKSFTGDNQVTIVGGRNVGDEYFGANDEMLFADLDALAIGSVVTDVSHDFDRYWASDSAYPLDRIVPPVDANALMEVARDAEALEQSPETRIYREAMRTLDFVQELKARRLPLEWAVTRMVSDDPGKGLGNAPPEDLLLLRLKKIVGPISTHLDLISPYFVPTKAGVEAFARLTASGVRVRVLTNAFEATDVAFVHAGYAKRRRELLKSSVVLYEFRGPLLASERGGSFISKGSSRTSLHAKTFAADERRIFIGSFNFDPRSANLNTEMGFVIESPALARGITSAFDQKAPRNAYELKLNAEGSIVWLEREGERTVVHDEEPNMSVWQRLLIRGLAALPIEWLL